MQNWPAKTVRAFSSTGSMAFDVGVVEHDHRTPCPPNSSPKRFIRLRPDGADGNGRSCVLPVKLIVGTSGAFDKERGAHPIRSRRTCSMTPPGRSVGSARVSARTLAIWAAWPGILTTTAQPAASAGREGADRQNDQESSRER
ncbi:hypothetical protein [Rhizobium yanglingense]